MNTLLAGLYWLLLLPLLPWLILQGRRTRSTALRLPEAAGDRHGESGVGSPFTLIIIGESPVAGVGVPHHRDGLGPALAAPLATLIDRRVHWYCHGSNGIRIAALLNDPLQELPERADAVLVMMGVNDTTGLTPVHLWRQHLRRLHQRLYGRFAAPVFFSAVPPMHHFTALPQPLRAIIGLRARLLDRVLASEFQRLDYGRVEGHGLLAEDGFHPSADGFRLMGERLAKALVHDLHQ